MHIIIDATTTQDEMSFHGIGQYTKNIVLSLLKNYPDLNISILLFEDKESTLGGYIERYDNCEVCYVGRYRSNNVFNNFYYFIQFLPAILKAKRRGSVYFCPYFWRNYPAFFMKTILFVHDFNLARFNMYSQKGKVFNFIRKIQYWKVMWKSYFCKYILCNSQTTKNDYLKYLRFASEKKVVVTYLGVDLIEQEIDIAELLPDDYTQKKYLIYLGGGINRSKNSLGVVNGYYEFLNNLRTKKGIDFDDAPYLIISGKAFIDSSKKEVIELHELVGNLGMRGKVLFTGFYDDNQKYSLLKNSLAFIHLSLYEGFGISTVEAMRSKTPVVVHESEVYKEVVGDSGIFVDGENAKQVGEILFKLYIAEKFTDDIAQRGYERSLMYSWDNTAKITHDILKKF